MKKILAVVLTGMMLFAMAACGSSDQDKNAGSSAGGNPQTSVEKENGDQGLITEEKAIQLAIEKAEMDFQNEEITVDGNSGRILDQNDTAYIVGLDIIDDISGNYMYIEAYWIHKESGEAKDVCSINEYYDGLIDITNGEPLF